MGCGASSESGEKLSPERAALEARAAKTREAYLAHADLLLHEPCGPDGEASCFMSPETGDELGSLSLARNATGSEGRSTVTSSDGGSGATLATLKHSPSTSEAADSKELDKLWAQYDEANSRRPESPGEPAEEPGALAESVSKMLRSLRATLSLASAAWDEDEEPDLEASRRASQDQQQAANDAPLLSARSKRSAMSGRSGTSSAFNGSQTATVLTGCGRLSVTRGYEGISAAALRFTRRRVIEWMARIEGPSAVPKVVMPPASARATPQPQTLDTESSLAYAIGV